MKLGQPGDRCYGIRLRQVDYSSATPERMMAIGQRRYPMALTWETCCRGPSEEDEVQSQARSGRRQNIHKYGSFDGTLHERKLADNTGLVGMAAVTV